MLALLFSLPASAQKNDSLPIHPEYFLCVLDGHNVKRPERYGIDTNGCELKENKFNYSFAKNCTFTDSRSGRAITPKYITFYDQRDETVTYLKLKNAKGHEYLKVKKHLQPQANQEMFVMIVARDTGYQLKVESDDYFKEYEESFAKSVEKAKSNTKEEGTSTPATKKDDATKEALVPIEKQADLLSMKLYSLNTALITLNGRYPKNSIIDEDYFRDLTCLRISIADQFGIPPPADEADFSGIRKVADRLGDSLTALIIKVGKGQELDSLVKTIASRYFEFAIKQIDNYQVFATQIQIPDKDYFDVSVEHTIKNKTTTVLRRHFQVSGGFKIDYSAGVFLTGLAVPEFVAQPHTFRYREANFTVDPTTGNLDTTFTGTLKDTIGHLIHVKNPRMNYAAGFLSHAYMRTGSFVNLGIATGLLVNNDGFQMLLGGSTLFSIRKSRLAFSGGMAIGKQKTLSPTIENALWKDTLKEGAVYDFSTDLPAFYTGPADVPYFDKWRTSWYFGLTFNFDSVAIRW